MPKPDSTRPVRRSSPVVRRADGPARRSSKRPPQLADTPGPAPQSSVDEVKLTVGRIERPHGVYGEFQASLTTDFPERLLALKTIFVGDENTPRKIRSTRTHKDRLIFKLAGIDTPEQVRSLSKTPLRIPGSAAVPLAEGEYFLFQLIDSAVVDENGARLGTLVDILETGANEVYVVRGETDKDELLLPNIPSVILSIDVTKGEIVVRPQEYL